VRGIGDKERQSDETQISEIVIAEIESDQTTIDELSGVGQLGDH
jgi:hypothetical protein